ncbi:MAG: gliding motility-associated C-terminal domain-containing protein, partial [Bacteroidota bacterium]|nr:gliding motility-associated C-terminal domain-containing protein [Bacteroidota bacterium]
ILDGILSWNSIPEFQFLSSMNAGTTYFISAVIADTGADGLPDLADPCRAVSSATPVTFYKYPIAFAGEDQLIGCNSQGITLSSAGSSNGPSFDYNWSSLTGILDGNPTDAQIIALSDGDYVLRVTQNIAGCVTFDTIQISLHQLSIDQLQINIIQPLCFGDCTGEIEIINATPDLFFDFGDGNFTNETLFDLVCSGTYPITVMDSLGCTRDTIVFIETQDPVEVSLGPDLKITIGDSVILIAQTYITTTGFNWFAADSCTSCVQITVAPLATTIYSVEVTDENLCTATDAIIVTVDFASEIFVPTVFSPNGDNINDRFVIGASRGLASIDHIEIYDRWGNKVFEENNFTPGDETHSWDGSYRGSMVNSGVYVFSIDAVFNDGRPLHLKGDITLLR